MFMVLAPVASSQEAKEHAVCYRCYQANGRPPAQALVDVLKNAGQGRCSTVPGSQPRPRAKHRLPSLGLLPANLESDSRRSAPNSVSANRHRPARLPIINLAMVPSNLESSQPAKPVVSKPRKTPSPVRLNTALGEQLRAKRERLDIIPVRETGQISRYFSPEQGRPRFETVSLPQPEVVRLVSRSRQERIKRAYALTGQPIPETPLGLAQRIGPIIQYQDRAEPEDRYEEVAAEFVDLEIHDTDWDFHEATRPSGHKRRDDSIQSLVERQILALIDQDQNLLRRLEAFQAFLAKQDIQ